MTPALATIEADHIHNLPDLLRRYNYHKIKYYWNSERTIVHLQVYTSNRRGADTVSGALGFIAASSEPLVTKM